MVIYSDVFVMFKDITQNEIYAFGTIKMPKSKFGILTI